MVVSLDYLYKKTNNFLKREYGIELGVPILINNRLESTYGNVKFYTDINGNIKGVDCIEFHPGILKSNRYSIINNLIKHEAIHYALIMQNKGYGDNDDDFIEELIKHNVGSCDLKLKKRFYLYRCANCGILLDVSRRKIEVNKYSCCHCKKRGRKKVNIDKGYYTYDEINKLILETNKRLDEC